MYKLKYNTSEYFDFKLVADKETPVDLETSIAASFDFGFTPAVTVLGKTQTTNQVLANISLTGLDNYLIADGLDGDDEIDETKTYAINAGDRFKIHSVSGYTQGLTYNSSVALQAVGEINYNVRKLEGAFYQGFFKIHEYPVEFFDVSASKGWTANMTIFHNPTTVGNSLNSLYSNNSGFLFYLGTRAEDKFRNPTTAELSRLNEDYDVTFDAKTTLYTFGGEFSTNGNEFSTTSYTGIYNYTAGEYWTLGNKTADSVKLTKLISYQDLHDNAFGIRITPNGYIGYRAITARLCEDELTQTGTTQGNNLGYIWETKTDPVRNTQYKQLVHPKYKVVEEYSKLPVMASRINKFVNITVTFRRYFSVKSRCELKYSKFRKGVLTIYVNGLPVLSIPQFEEVFPKELDAIAPLQEGVPFTLSIGGGTQGLKEAVYLDPTKTIDGVLEKYFAGTYTGSLKKFDFYTAPADFVQVRKKTKKEMTIMSLPITFGGRIVSLY